MLCGLLCYASANHLVAQSGDLEILNCPTAPVNLCVEDDGVRFPDNNQIFLGEEDPEATSCSVHVQRRLNMSTDCGSLNYEVLLYLFDTAEAIVLQPVTTFEPDTNGSAELVFDTEMSPDDAIRLSGIPLNTGCLPYHRIEWIVSDTCGEEIICEMQMNLYDCQTPEVLDTNDYYIVEVPISCYVTLSAVDYSAFILDDCSSKDEFLFSFDSLEYSPDSMIYQCELPAYGVPIPWSIWVADHGIDLDCNGEVDWDERSIYKKDIQLAFTVDDTGCCEPPSDSLYYGFIRTVFGEGIKDVEVRVTAPGYLFPSYFTSENGGYQLYYEPGIDVTITPQKNDNHRNGVSILDLVKIQKHLLGKDPFTTLFEYLAADANNSQTISAIDLIELRKLILGIYIELPNNYSWRFISEESLMQDTLDPWFHLGYVVTNPYLDEKSLDFIGVKIGDLNGTAQPNFTSLIPRETLAPLPLYAEDYSFNSGDIIEVPIHINSDQSLLGMQFTLAAEGMKIINVLPGKLSVSNTDFALFGDRMTFCWLDANGLDVAAGETLFTLQLQARKAGQLSSSVHINSDITAAELYLSNEQSLMPSLSFVKSNGDTKEHLVVCAPNPWKNETSISFFLNAPSEVQLNVIDINGIVVKSYVRQLSAGVQRMPVFENVLSGSGLYFYRITSKEFDTSGKMFLLK